LAALLGIVAAACTNEFAVATVVFGELTAAAASLVAAELRGPAEEVESMPGGVLPAGVMAARLAAGELVSALLEFVAAALEAD
jgi:hypothetical protein